MNFIDRFITDFDKALRVIGGGGAASTLGGGVTPFPHAASRDAAAMAMSEVAKMDDERCTLFLLGWWGPDTNEFSAALSRGLRPPPPGGAHRPLPPG